MAEVAETEGGCDGVPAGGCEECVDNDDREDWMEKAAVLEDVGEEFCNFEFSVDEWFWGVDVGQDWADADEYDEEFGW